MKSKYIPPEHLCKISSCLNRVDRELVSLLVDTGFRLDDVLHLRRWQLCGDVLSIRESKTGKTRSKILSCEHTSFWKKDSENRSPFSYAFPNLTAAGQRKKMHRSSFWRHFSAAVKACGFENLGYSPHSLRKVYAVNLFRETGSLSAVQEDLGHTSASTTMIYALSDVLEDIERFNFASLS